VNPKRYKLYFSERDIVSVFDSKSILAVERTGLINFISQYEVSIILDKDIEKKNIQYSIFKLYSDSYRNIFSALSKLQN
jgi:hypothetical protein